MDGIWCSLWELHTLFLGFVTLVLDVPHVNWFSVASTYFLQFCRLSLCNTGTIDAFPERVGFSIEMYHCGLLYVCDHEADSVMIF